MTHGERPGLIHKSSSSLIEPLLSVWPVNIDIHSYSDYSCGNLDLYNGQWLSGRKQSEIWEYLTRLEYSLPFKTGQ